MHSTSSFGQREKQTAVVCIICHGESKKRRQQPIGFNIISHNFVKAETYLSTQGCTSENTASYCECAKCVGCLNLPQIL